MGLSSASQGPVFPSEDLSEDLYLLLPREPGEIVRCTRVNDRHYRCNWWRSVYVDSYDNPGLKGAQLATTYRVHRSAFLEVIRHGDDLKINEVHSCGGRRSVNRFVG